ncbi:MAG: HPr family phosphocarrier protein [Lachnospiraceae bacterium]|nr:HPr family phosphocarrier protein [Lachnospiraceae bacterium]
MVQKSVQIQLAQGLEARLAAVLVQKASLFDSKVYIESEGRKVNAKSIMGMMSLALNTGDQVTVMAEGDDEAAAVDKLENYISGKEAE